MPGAMQALGKNLRNKNKQTKTQSPHWVDATSLSSGKQSTARCCLLASDSWMLRPNTLQEGKNWALWCVRKCYHSDPLSPPLG